MNRGALCSTFQEVPDVGLNNPIPLPLVDRYTQCVQRIMRSSSGPKPIGETAEVAFVDGVELHDAGPLDDLVFQSCNRQRPLLSVRLRYIRPARRLRSVGSPRG